MELVVVVAGGCWWGLLVVGSGALCVYEKRLGGESWQYSVVMVRITQQFCSLIWLLVCSDFFNVQVFITGVSPSCLCS